MKQSHDAIQIFFSQEPRLSRSQKSELKLESALQNLKSSCADFNGYGEILLFRGSKIFWQFSTLVDVLESKDFWIRICLTGGRQRFLTRISLSLIPVIRKFTSSKSSVFSEHQLFSSDKAEFARNSDFRFCFCRILVMQKSILLLQKDIQFFQN